MILEFLINRLMFLFIFFKRLFLISFTRMLRSFVTMQGNRPAQGRRRVEARATGAEMPFHIYCNYSRPQKIQNGFLIILLFFLRWPLLLNKNKHISNDFFCFFISFHCPLLLLPPCRCSGVPGFGLLSSNRAVLWFVRHYFRSYIVRSQNYLVSWKSFETTDSPCLVWC